jgi:DNA-binding transcriptional LysR family regulator
MDLQVTHLRTLQAIARHGSFSRAAQALNLTQPAVSMQVRHLERSLGLSLLERVGKRAFPTRAGELLLAHADRALRELEAGVERVQELRGVVAGRVRLGTSASISIYLLPPALRRFRTRYPDTEVVIVTGNASEITRAIVANELDVGIVSLPVRDRELVVTPFFRDELVAIAATTWGATTWPPKPPGRSEAPRRSRDAPRSRLLSEGLVHSSGRSEEQRRGRGVRRAGRWKTVDAPTLAAYPLILFEAGATLRRVIDGWFHRAGVAPRSPMELGNTEAIKKLVEAGLGLSVTSWFSVVQEVRARTLTAMRLVPPLQRQIGLVRRRDKPHTPALDAFVATLEDLRRALETRRPSRTGGHS